MIKKYNWLGVYVYEFCACMHAHVCVSHQWQQVQEQSRVLSDQVVSLTA